MTTSCENESLAIQDRKMIQKRLLIGVKIFFLWPVNFVYECKSMFDFTSCLLIQ